MRNLCHIWRFRYFISRWQNKNEIYRTAREGAGLVSDVLETWRPGFGSPAPLQQLVWKWASACPALEKLRWVNPWIHSLARLDMWTRTHPYYTPQTHTQIYRPNTKNELAAGEVAQWLRTHAAFPWSLCCWYFAWNLLSQSRSSSPSSICHNAAFQHGYLQDLQSLSSLTLWPMLFFLYKFHIKGAFVSMAHLDHTYFCLGWCNDQMNSASEENWERWF